MIVLREATVADLVALCALGNEVNEMHHRAWPHLFAPKGEPGRDRDFWIANIDRDAATTFVAEDDGHIIAFISVSVADEKASLLMPVRYGKIGSICVTEARRGEGIGRRLMTTAESWAIERGATDLRLNVWAFNQAALRMYDELGYEIRSTSLGKRVDA